MSAELIERVRVTYAAFSRGDLDGALVLFDDEITWHQAQGLAHGGVYHGLATVRREVFDPIAGSWWSAFDALPDTYLDAGETIVVLGRYVGRARESGKPLDVPFVHVWEFADGRAVVFRQYTDTYGWRAALALD